MIKAGLNNTDRILLVGAGNTRLVDELIGKGYSDVIAADISAKSLDQLKHRVGEKVSLIEDDLSNPKKLREIQPVDLWIDRAVLHFFTKEKDSQAYLGLLKLLVKPNGYVFLAEFSENGAKNCSGLSVLRYSVDMMQQFLGDEFNLIEHFKYNYTMPSGDLRPYNYSLFRRRSEPRTCILR